MPQMLQHAHATQYLTSLGNCVSSDTRKTVGVWRRKNSLCLEIKRMIKILSMFLSVCIYFYTGFSLTTGPNFPLLRAFTLEHP